MKIGKVYVPKTMLHYPTKQLFVRNNWEVIDTPERAHLICFTGGEDISPLIYGQIPHITSHYNLERDAMEIELYENNDCKFMGICRGAQLLAALNDCQLIQNITSEHPSQHIVNYITDNSIRPIMVNSLHHQAIIESPEMDVFMKQDKETTGYVVDKHGKEILVKEQCVDGFILGDCLGVQFHPELSGCDPFAEKIIFNELSKLVGA